LQAAEPIADPAASTATASIKKSEPIDFNRDIRPILANHCIACHGPDAQKRAGDLRLDLRDEAIAKQTTLSIGLSSPSSPPRNSSPSFLRTQIQMKTQSTVFSNTNFRRTNYATPLKSPSSNSCDAFL